MHTKLVASLIAVTAVFLIACSPEPVPPPAQITGTDSSTASATTNAATTAPTGKTPTAVDQVTTAPAKPQSEPPAAPESPTPTKATTVPSAAKPTSHPPPPSPTNTAKPKPAALQVTIAHVPVNLPQYDRADWKHWTDDDRDCQDARQEALVAESVITPAFQTDRECRVEAGQWLAPYSAIIITDPGDLDIDHMLPLRNAHDSGAWAWTPKRKRIYANYLDDPQHLIAVTASANRSKGARGPEDWKPDDQTYWCQYSIDWITVKSTWELTVSREEHKALAAMLTTCHDPPRIDVTTQPGSGVSPRATSTPAPNQPASATYASCDAADAADEPRVQGTQGPGKGFPAWMVPSARDGDGDGVVCEK